MGAYIRPTQGTPQEHLAQVTRDIVPLGHTGKLLYEAILPRTGDVAGLPSTQKQALRGSPNEETREHDLNQRTGQNSRKIN